MAWEGLRNTYNTAAGQSTGGKGLFSGFSGGDWLGAGLSILGGFMGDRSDSRNSQRAIRAQREISEADRRSREALTREEMRVAMQRDQDTYARDIMRNRAAIAPWGQVYRGPRFSGVDPNAPIYNPLMEQGSLYQSLAPPPPPATPPPRRG